jgi:hypothetical protein
MALTTVNAKMKQRTDSAANWTSDNPILLKGEMGVETDTGLCKFGDGSTAWNDLSYAYDKYGAAAAVVVNLTTAQDSLDNSIIGLQNSAALGSRTIDALTANSNKIIADAGTITAG